MVMYVLNQTPGVNVYEDLVVTGGYGEACEYCNFGVTTFTRKDVMMFPIPVGQVCNISGGTSATCTWCYREQCGLFCLDWYYSLQSYTNASACSNFNTAGCFYMTASAGNPCFTGAPSAVGCFIFTYSAICSHTATGSICIYNCNCLSCADLGVNSRTGEDGYAQGHQFLHVFFTGGCSVCLTIYNCDYTTHGAGSSNLNLQCPFNTIIDYTNNCICNGATTCAVVFGTAGTLCKVQLCSYAYGSSNNRFSGGATLTMDAPIMRYNNCDIFTSLQRCRCYCSAAIDTSTFSTVIIPCICNVYHYNDFNAVVEYNGITSKSGVPICGILPTSMKLRVFEHMKLIPQMNGLNCLNVYSWCCTVVGAVTTYCYNLQTSVAAYLYHY